MAKQKGIMTLKGKVGNFSFYQGQDGYGARNSDGLDGERVKSSNDFERTRENGMEFGRAGRAGKLIRDALTTALQTIADKRLTSRLTTEMVKVVKSDPTSDRGDRCAENGDISILAGFDFNAKSPLSTSIIAPFVATIDRATGAGQVTIPSFIPVESLALMPGATHCRLTLGILALDFENNDVLQTMVNSELLALSRTAIPDIVLSANLPAGFNELPIILVLGIKYTQVVNGKEYALKNAAYNAMAIVETSNVTVPAAV